MLTTREKERYQRQIAIEEMGVEGQLKLKQARVLIAGAGGLGSPAAIYLSVAGVGALGIVDHDTVALSNLNRQILHAEEDIGQPKTDSARKNIKRFNSDTAVETVPETLTEANINSVVSGFDVVVDALDNLPTRYLLNLAAISQGIPLIHGAVKGFEGRVMTILPGQSACLQCMHQGRIPEKSVTGNRCNTCRYRGHSGHGDDQVITGIGELLNGRMILYDGLSTKLKSLSHA